MIEKIYLNFVNFSKKKFLWYSINSKIFFIDIFKSIYTFKTLSKNKVINFCQNLGLIPKTVTCAICKNIMKLNKRTRNIEWRC